MRLDTTLALGGLLLAPAGAAISGHGHSHKHLHLQARSLLSAGGWSLSTGITTCPVGTASCFGDLTGNKRTQNRNENCCPSGTTPRLDCGTYVNTGQPYACCPLGNADCRGDVEASDATDKCANSGWALWHVPYGGGYSPDRGINGTATTLNSFCCLPNHYGYYFPRFGQDAVGQCSDDKILPNGALPGVQDNNGDGSVSPSGVQIYTLPAPAPTVAPTCDLVSYGWSLQTSNKQCASGSNLCSYGGACCPSTLNCGTVVGDSEVAVCCPPENPDCRGDVEGLFPQVCADSSWSLWHVNTNGNHFCCLPGQIGYNIINDNTAVGFCGSSVPNGTMRSILDYPGDGSTPGSYLQFPCDSSPAPNDTYSSIAAAIISPPPGLNPTSVVLATALYTNTTTVIPAPVTTYTTSITSIYTMTSCPATVTDCPAKMGQVTTEVVEVLTTVCPVSESAGLVEAPPRVVTLGSTEGVAATYGAGYTAPAGSPAETAAASAAAAEGSTAVVSGTAYATGTGSASPAVFTGAAAGLGVSALGVVGVAVVVAVLL